MSRISPFFTVLFAVALSATVSAAEATGANTSGGGDAWYKVATGIIAIPAAILGLVISFNVLRKTTLESRKLELEIVQKQAEIRVAEPGDDRLQTIAQPVAESQRVLLLIVRFVVLELTLRLWNVVPAAVGYITGFIPTILLFAFRGRLSEVDTTAWPFLSATLIPTVVSLLFSLVYWSILFGFGWPLLRDTCTYLNIPINSLWDLPFAGRWHRAKPDVSPPTG